MKASQRTRERENEKRRERKRTSRLSFSLFLSLSLFSRGQYEKWRHLRGQEEQRAGPSSAMLRPIKLLVSFVYLGRRMTQFYRNVAVLTTTCWLERYRPEDEDTRREFDPTYSRAVITRLSDSSCSLLGQSRKSNARAYATNRSDMPRKESRNSTDDAVPVIDSVSLEY